MTRLFIPLSRLLTSRILTSLACLALLVFAALPEIKAATHYPITVRDALGRTVTIKAAPKRIISLSPSNTECIYALRAGSRVVGVTSFCDYPEAALKVAKVGGFSARTISIEAIVALKPDLVVAGDQTQQPVIDSLSQLGITVISVKVKGFDELCDQLDLLGQILDQDEAAREITGSIRTRVSAVTKLVAAIPYDKRVRVYWEVFDEPLMSCGPRSIIGQLVELAGGINIFADLRDEFPQVSPEAVITRNPAIIMGPELMRARSLTLERLRSRPGWGQIDAVHQGRLFIFPDNIVARPGPRLIDGLALIARSLYPEQFKDFTP